MALLKSIDTDSGAAATYWRIVRAEYDVLAMTIRYYMAGYVNEAARVAGKVPLKQVDILLTPEPNTQLPSVTWSALYEHAKTFALAGSSEPLFVGAEDA
ncbi:hypothetical protein [Reyranella massiliensis]|uniref:hypothetical protein n=1 Tax=Reyranella massiliensis TaxID=445220 RepID=UPI0002DD1C77|nr:hypothetical protein [Reyranella massiliensis]